MTTQEQILRILRGQHQALSGEVLSRQIGVSRVSIWKNIKKLKESGHEIITSPKGYRLKNADDVLYAWNFPTREHTIHYFPEAASTMDIAREMARGGCPAFSTIVADRQTRGRGRLSRSWISDIGGLYFTVVTRPAMVPLYSFRVNFAASVVLARLLRRLFAVDARVKWPNDILIGNRKICGMLSEMEAEGDRLDFVNLGIGLNVNNDPSDEEPRATSLARELGHAVSRREILAEFIDAFEKRLAANLDTIIDDWRPMTATIGQRVTIVTLQDRFEGRALDVDNDGALILEQDDGNRQRVVYGDCFHTG